MLIEVGSIFSLLVFVHFIFDWLFQPRWMAEAKGYNSWIRLLHSLIYVFPFIIGVAYLTHSMLFSFVWFFVLIMSHYIIDSYLPTFYWLKYVLAAKDDSGELITFEAMKKWFSKPINMLITIVVDHVFHFVFLLALAIFLAIIL